MTKCVSCGTAGAYVGIRFVECLNAKCTFYSEKYKKDEEKAHKKNEDDDDFGLDVGKSVIINPYTSIEPNPKRPPLILP